jgi:hypothetical protein
VVVEETVEVKKIAEEAMVEVARSVKMITVPFDGSDERRPSRRKGYLELFNPGIEILLSEQGRVMLAEELNFDVGGYTLYLEVENKVSEFNFSSNQTVVNESGHITLSPGNIEALFSNNACSSVFNVWVEVRFMDGAVVSTVPQPQMTYCNW